jgi:hypothetical protein
VTRDGIRSSCCTAPHERFLSQPRVPKSKAPPRPTAASRRFAEQLRPLVHAYDDVRRHARATFDVERARARVRAGRAAFDATSLLDASGDLTHAFQRTAAAFERTGIATTAELTELRRSEFDATELVVGWATGGSTPVDTTRRLARAVAAVVGNAVLARAARDVAEGVSFAEWRWKECPCCGASPDLVLTTPKRRTLVCWRCDTMWRTAQRGCLGCGAHEPPELARVVAPELQYELTICNSCGRYLKERRGLPAHELIVERAFTAGLDEAAQQRGLRA